MNKPRLALSTLAVLITATASAAIDPFYGDSKRGWFWHEDPALLQEQEPPKAPPTPPPAPPTAPTAAKPTGPQPGSVEWVEVEYKKARNRSIDSPTDENLRAEMALEALMHAKAQRYASRINDVRRGSEFDSNTEWSAATFGQRAAEQNVAESELRLMKAVSKVAGLWMFYRSDCSYCRAEVPVLVNLKQQYGMNILPISLDGQALPGAEALGKWINDAGQSARLGVQTTPTLFLSHPASNTLVPLAHGAIAQDELTRRIVEAAVKSGWVAPTPAERLRVVPVPQVDTPAGAEVDTSNPKAVVDFVRKQLKK